MARKQMNIPGTERETDPELDALAEDYRETRDARAELSKRETVKRLALLAGMRARKLKKHRYLDDNGEELEVWVDDEPTVKIRKTGEAESNVGDGVPSMPNAPTDDGVPIGLIDQAMKAQADMGIEETPEGDVVPIESGKAAKKTRGAKKKS